MPEGSSRRGESNEIISLREYLEHRQDASEKQLEIRLEERDKALGIQAAELSRRLDNLNHQHQQIQGIQLTYLPREIWKQQHDELSDRVDNNDQKLELLLSTYVPRNEHIGKEREAVSKAEGLAMAMAKLENSVSDMKGQLRIYAAIMGLVAVVMPIALQIIFHYASR